MIMIITTTIITTIIITITTVLSQRMIDYTRQTDR